MRRRGTLKTFIETINSLREGGKRPQIPYLEIVRYPVARHAALFQTLRRAGTPLTISQIVARIQKENGLALTRPDEAFLERAISRDITRLCKRNHINCCSSGWAMNGLEPRAEGHERA
jgi:hypothetical protein